MLVSNGQAGHGSVRSRP